MKTENEQPDTYLAEWLAGKISDTELKNLVSESDFVAYLKLRDSAGEYCIAAADMERNYQQIQAKINARKSMKKPTVFRLLPYISIAAALLVLFGVYHLFAYSHSKNTGIGAKSTLTLPDNSLVHLNGQSLVEYPTLFQYNRKIKLLGEAFFDVKEGSTFCVNTENGSVEVLGTQFNVLARDGYLEVVCCEGRVKVTTSEKSIILSRGNGVRLYGGKLEQWTERAILKPSWISGESTFRNVPFQILIDQFKSQYDYKIKFPKSLSHIKFSGAFPNDNLELALQAICLPLKLNYAITEDRTIILSK